jgi:hypothetical protein
VKERLSNRSFYSVFLLLLFFFFSCGRQEQPAPSAETGSLTTKLAGFTPDGWELYDQVLRFTPENLYEQINGRAEFYLAYDMVEMTFASFEKNGDDLQFIDVSIYDMDTPTRAFGVFSGERTKGAPSVELGREAYRSGANYYIWKGQYYIQIVASDANEELRRLGMVMARKAADLVSDSGEPVWGLSTLPEKDRVPQSEQYFLVDALGLDFMRNTYTASYDKAGTNVEVFLSRRDSPEAAQTALARYVEYGERYGEGVERPSVDGVELVSCDMGGSYDIVFQKGWVIGGVAAVEDQDIALQAALDLWWQIHEEQAEVPRR